jgi:hypothetical protein
VEEGLRLASLPGETEGRVYYFRRLYIRGLPISGDRGAWLGAFQESLSDEAARAVHAADPRSPSSAAVFFWNETEVLEILLERLLEGRPLHEWFWGSALGPGSDNCDPAAVIEALRESPASWRAVAAAVFSSAGIDPVHLLHSIPASRAGAWLRELEGGAPSPLAPVETALHQRARGVVARALVVLGERDPRVVWLAALAVLLTCPGDLDAGTAVWRARLALRKMVSRHVVQPADSGEPSRSIAAPPGRAFAETAPALMPEDRSVPYAHVAAEATPYRREDGGPNFTSEPESSLQTPEVHRHGQEEGPSPADEPRLERADATAPDEPASATLELERRGGPIARVNPDAPHEQDTAAPAPILLGLPTSAGGLFFLLNAFQTLELPAALASGLNWLCPDFPPRLLARLAEHAGVDERDPILIWVRSLIVNPPDAGISTRPASWWPLGLLPSKNPASLDDLLRAWAVATRRWCWRAGRITVREIITRSGLFSVNRTDLDVSLPLETADVRIRRLGLDLDPGRLPWFGRIVHFHYPPGRNFYA